MEKTHEQSQQPMIDPYQELLQYNNQNLWDMLARSYRAIETLYEEHLRVLSLLSVLALGLHYPCGIYTLPPDHCPSSSWTRALIIDLPGGQLCWLVPPEKLHYFREMPIYKGVWRGIPRMDDQLRLLLNPQCAFQSYLTEKIHAIALPPLD